MSKLCPRIPRVVRPAIPNEPAAVSRDAETANAKFYVRPDIAEM